MLLRLSSAVNAKILKRSKTFGSSALVFGNLRATLEIFNNLRRSSGRLPLVSGLTTHHAPFQHGPRQPFSATQGGGRDFKIRPLEGGSYERVEELI